MRATASPGDGRTTLHPLPSSHGFAQAGSGRSVVWTLHLLEPQRVPWGHVPFLNGGRGEHVLVLGNHQAGRIEGCGDLATRDFGRTNAVAADRRAQ